MNRSRLCRGSVALAVAGLGMFTGRAVRAGEMIENPKYHAWVKFKPGSNSTVSADGNKFHIELTRTLISLDDDKAVVEIKSSLSMNGQHFTAPARQETVPAKTDKEQFTQTGEKDIEAMDKTFKCKVYEAKGDPDAAPAPGAPNPDSMKATVYTSDDVPGGLVRLEATQKDGKPLTFILTAMESK